MSTHAPLRALLTIVLVVPALATVPSCAAPPASDAFALEQLAERVWVARPQTSELTHANSLIVERDDGLLVVDAQPTRPAARDLLAALGRRFDSEVRYLVLSSPYADAIGGAAEFGGSVIVIGSSGCFEAMTDPAFDFDAPAGSVAPETPRPPSLSLDARSVLRGNAPEIELLPVGHARTVGDLIVRIAEPGIVYLGGMAFHAERNPYAGGAKFSRWLGLLNDVISGPPVTVVGARGAPAKSFEIAPQRDALVWTRSQVTKAWVDNIPREEMAAHVLAAPDLAKYFDVEAQPSNLRSLVERVIEENFAARRKRGQL